MNKEKFIEWLDKNILEAKEDSMKNYIEELMRDNNIKVNEEFEIINVGHNIRYSFDSALDLFWSDKALEIDNKSIAHHDTFKRLLTGKHLIRKIPKTKPPVGLIPRVLHDEHRQNEILAAIKRYNEAKTEIPTEWTEELKEIEERSNKNNAEEIKPCPFCGSSGKLIATPEQFDYKQEIGFRIICNAEKNFDCGSRLFRIDSRYGYKTKQQAINEWNKRV